MRGRFGASLSAAILLMLTGSVASAQELASLTGRPGDAQKGRAIVTNRQVGLCTLCHSGPFPEVPFMGNLAPDLTGVGGRYSEGQLRARIVDPSRTNAETIMPSYLKADGFNRVAPAFQGKSILTADQIEDVVAFLATLRAETTP